MPKIGTLGLLSCFEKGQIVIILFVTEIFTITHLAYISFWIPLNPLNFNNFTKYPFVLFLLAFLYWLKRILCYLTIFTWLFYVLA